MAKHGPPQGTAMFAPPLTSRQRLVTPGQLQHPITCPNGPSGGVRGSEGSPGPEAVPPEGYSQRVPHPLTYRLPPRFPATQPQYGEHYRSHGDRAATRPLPARARPPWSKKRPHRYPPTGTAAAARPARPCRD